MNDEEKSTRYIPALRYFVVAFLLSFSASILGFAIGSMHLACGGIIGSGVTIVVSWVNAEIYTERERRMEEPVSIAGEVVTRREAEQKLKEDSFKFIDI